MARPRGRAPEQRSRILLVEDHPVMLEGLRALIAREPDLEVVGHAEEATAAMALIGEAKPDLVLVDITLRSGNGIDLIKRVRGGEPAMKMLVFTMYDEYLYAERALRAGASGYICKQEPAARILEAIRAVLRGQVFLSERMAGHLLRRAVGGTRIERTPMETLTDRELEIFELIGQGLDGQQIAVRLHLSSKTVDTYCDRIRIKLDVFNRSELLYRAARWNFENCMLNTSKIE